MEVPIEKKTAPDLIREWESELDALRAANSVNPGWEWKPLQIHLERLHALAHEINSKKAQERAKWQP